MENLVLVEKTCTKCLTPKDLEQFPKHKRYNGGHSSWCYKCLSKRASEWAKNNKEKVSESGRKSRNKHPNTRRNAKLMALYGITLSQFEEMSNLQNDICAICPKHKSENKNGKLFVDHSHATGKVRGLLCDDCNRAIGLLKDDPGLLRSAIAYLERQNDL